MFESVVEFHMSLHYPLPPLELKVPLEAGYGPIYDTSHAHTSSRVTSQLPLQVAKQLADCVIPNEYGIDAGSKTRIGSKICCALLGKLLADLSNMQEESIATAVSHSLAPVLLHVAKSLHRTLNVIA